MKKNGKWFLTAGKRILRSRLTVRWPSPVVGATKLHHIEGAVKAVELGLTQEELAYLEEPYVPHPLAGVMAQNKPAAAKEKHVWSTGDQKIGK